MDMRNLRRLLIATTVLMVLLVCACAASAYTIKGKVTYPDGTPAGGVKMALFSHTGVALDLYNDYWKIPNMDHHLVTTAADGTFTMTNVADYYTANPAWNPTRRYIVFYQGPDPFYHSTTHVLLTNAPETINLNIKLQRASSLRLQLTDVNGNPVNGTRAIFIRSGVLGQGPMKGVSFIETATFVNGAAELPFIVVKDLNFGSAKIAVLNFSTAEECHDYLKANGIPHGDFELTRLPADKIAKDLSGVFLNHDTSLVSGGYTTLTYSLK